MDHPFKSLLKSKLRKLKLNQRNGYYITESSGEILKIELNINPDEEILSSLQKSFNECKFRNLNLVMESSKNHIECTFINLDNVDYNPFTDVTAIKIINDNISVIKNNIIYTDLYRLYSVIIHRRRTVTAKTKYEIVKSVEKMVLILLNYHKINTSLRLAIYELNTESLQVDVSLLFNQKEIKNELFLDELYFLYSI